MPKSALVVDDSSTMRLMISRVLAQAGFSVTQASNGKEALEKLDGAPVDLMITDLNMPVMDGLELIREVRANPKYKFTPIVFLTTESQADKMMEGKKAGATAWMLKPLKPDVMMQTIARIFP